MRARMVEINARGVEQAHPTAGQLDLLFQYALGSQVDEHTTDLVTDLDPLPRWARAQLSARSAAQPDVVVQRLETTDFARFFERPEFAENAAEVRAGWVRERREWIVQYLAPQARALWAARHPK
ncbi:MAG: hypothetical protein EPO68_07935 [Planctomycetota bacterium]|nr:MAG: hypothetical protein EPO68_07935 [Planctomycetota bacterium]